MKAILLAATIAAAACGTPPNPDTPSGVCFVDKGFTYGRVWRPCEGDDSVSCTVRILDQRETLPLDDPQVMSCRECYGTLPGDCK